MISASVLLHAHRAEVREQALCSKQETSLSIHQFMQQAFRNAERGLPMQKKNQPPPPSALDGGDSETDDEGWETDLDGIGNQEEPLLPGPEDLEE